MAEEKLPCFEATDGFFAAGEKEDRLGEQSRFKNQSIKRIERRTFYIITIINVSMLKQELTSKSMM